MSARKIVSLRKGEAAPSSAYAAAVEASVEARFDVAAAYLEYERPKSAAESGRVELLRAQIARCTSDLRTWFDAATLASRDHASPDGRLTATALAAAAARRLENEEEADRLFARVRKAVVRDVRDETVFAAYLLGCDAWMRRDYDDAEAIVAPFLELRDVSASALTLAGWISARRRRYREAGVHFAAALTAHEASDENGAYVRASLINAVAMVAFETADGKLGRRARKSYDALEWTPALAYYQYCSLVSLRYLSLLEGDLERAWFESREATRVAPTPAYRAMSEIDAASSSRLIGDEHAALLQFRRAFEIIKSERWGNASEEERVALSDFAAEAAREMPAEARHAMTIHRSLRAKSAPYRSLDDDGRIEAFTIFAVARVEEAMGERARATESYRRALEHYGTLGMNFRIAIVAGDLFRLTRDEGYREMMEDALKRSPKAWLLANRSPADSLGPKAREILARLLVGESAKTVAAELGRSTFTISNHTRRIFEVFEVHSRDELREKCAELGVTPVTLRAR